MFKKMSIVILFVSILLSGCMKKTITDEKNNILPEEFINVYLVLDYSNQFSDTIGNLTANLYYENIISSEVKDEIGTIWKEHKKYINALQIEVNLWYKEIGKGNTNYDTTRTLELLKSVVLNTKLISTLFNKYVEDETVLLSISISDRIIKLSNVKGE